MLSEQLPFTNSGRLAGWGLQVELGRLSLLPYLGAQPLIPSADENSLLRRRNSALCVSSVPLTHENFSFPSNLSPVDDLHDLDALLLEVLQHLDHGPCPLGRVLPVLVQAELGTNRTRFPRLHIHSERARMQF